MGGAVMERFSGVLAHIAGIAILAWFFVLPVIGALYLIGVLK